MVSFSVGQLESLSVGTNQFKASTFGGTGRASEGFVDSVQFNYANSVTKQV